MCMAQLAYADFDAQPLSEQVMASLESLVPLSATHDALSNGISNT